ncbi:hypothetical protein [Fictibacillus barbaricus]|uniref:Uncharacterized protein n=1 Tax=Fictibacillus barbaricus TaxID=182136 RepID=A0ABU1TZZ8_9BACL|nr:hypothetical protein [Fictibacillus barbaricus]MDR7072794.1 hypothetical protein [Fictibacillus barbaricus]
MKIIEAVIDLLFSNIAFVILVAGGIFSFIKRMNETKAGHRPEPSKKRMERPKQQVSPFVSQAETGSHSARAQSNQKEMSLKASDSHSLHLEKKEEKSARSRYQDKEKEIVSSLIVNQSELKKAVIWSEILSKPKALQKRS